ncbi:hypothetical protein GCM10010406_27160 [Streptomyces thermolineatus]|uniref:DUF3263 domain-containing protein n=1 Tax=Streptomyces thermolineatus TaxID=44033 RepID=A0ABP5Z5X1_9ACTN
MGEDARRGEQPLPEEAGGGPVLPAEQAGPEPVAGPGPDTAAEPGAGRETGPETGPETGRETGRENSPEAGPESGPGHDPGAGSRPGEEPRGRPGGLSELDLAVLDIARRQWRTPAQRERAVRERLGIPPTRYYQLLNALLDVPEALAHDPVTVNRLRRMREARRGRR